MFSSVVVPLDLSTAADRALPVARSLARLGNLTLELVTVVPRDVGDGLDRWALDERVKSLELGPHSSVVLESDDAGVAITEHVAGRDGVLLVLATTAKAAIDADYAGTVSERVLAESRQPVLLVGPRVDVDRRPSPPVLIVAADGSGIADAALPVVVSWTRTFPGEPPTIVEVIPFLPAISQHAGPVLEARHVRKYASSLAELGVEAETEVVHAEDAATALGDYAETVEGAVLVVTAERWAGAGTHWHSTSRKLARRSTRPVLVVPADLAAR